MTSRLFLKPLALAAVFTAVTSILPAQRVTVVTNSGTTVEGTVLREDDNTIQLRTDYGELTFRKMNLRDIRRPGGGGASGGAGDAFGGAGSSSGSSNPFGGSGGANPFGGSGSGGGNPFGGSGGSANPFAPSGPASSGTDNLFGGTTTASSGSANPFGSGGLPADASSAASEMSRPANVSVADRRAVPVPEVPFAWDAVLFHVRENGNPAVIAQPGSSRESEDGDTLLRNGAVVETTSLPVRVVFKNGTDVIRIAPRSRVELIESSADSVTLQLDRGAFWADLGSAPRGRTFTVGSSQATVLARGQASFRVSDFLDRGLSLAVVQGPVHLRSANAQMDVRVPDNQMMLVRPDGAIEPPEPLTQLLATEYSGWDGLAEDWWREDDSLSLVEHAMAEDWVSINELPSYLDEVAAAFARFTSDTGHIPTAAEGFSVLLENRGDWPGWQGPYWEGMLPPLDSWGRPMRYSLRNPGSGREVGVVYSYGADQTDNQGDPSADLTEMVLYYQLN